MIILLFWHLCDAKYIEEKDPGKRYMITWKSTSEIKNSIVIGYILSFVHVGLECDETSTGLGRVGGPDACQVKAHSKPWMVYLSRGCGGTMISKRVVLSAAHCICKVLWGSVTQPAGECNGWVGQTVIVGEHDTEKIEDGDQKFEIEMALAHKAWTGIRYLIVF